MPTYDVALKRCKWSFIHLYQHFILTFLVTSLFFLVRHEYKISMLLKFERSTHTQPSKFSFPHTLYMPKSFKFHTFVYMCSLKTWQDEIVDYYGHINHIVNMFSWGNYKIIVKFLGDVVRHFCYVQSL
jgi:hypothetical protein